MTSCNGCRVLRKGCSQSCPLKSCLEWIDSPRAQSNATIFLAKFFGRRDLMIFIECVPSEHRPVLFQSLLLEACGRIINPVDGAMGLMHRRMLHVCESAVDMVLAQGYLTRPPSSDLVVQNLDDLSHSHSAFHTPPVKRFAGVRTPPKSQTEISDVCNKNNEERLLNLFK